MNSFIENALSRKPLQLVRQQAHLGDESRYTPVAILSTGGEDTGEDDGSSYFNAAAEPKSRVNSTREAPLRHLSLFDLVGALDDYLASFQSSRYLLCL